MYFISIDFESFGGITPQNGFCQMGAVLFDCKNDTIVSSFSMNAKQNYLMTEDRCLKEFWSKHPDLYQKNKEQCSKSEYDCYGVIRIFWEWFDLHKNVHNNDCYFIGDNVAYDYGILRAFSHRNIMVAFGTYRDIVDVSTYYNAYAHVPFYTSTDLDKSDSSAAIVKILNKEIPNFEFEHTHTAIDDASYIAHKWNWFNKNLMTLTQ